MLRMTSMDGTILILFFNRNKTMRTASDVRGCTAANLGEEASIRLS